MAGVIDGISKNISEMLLIGKLKFFFKVHVIFLLRNCKMYVYIIHCCKPDSKHKISLDIHIYSDYNKCSYHSDHLYYASVLNLVLSGFRSVPYQVHA